MKFKDILAALTIAALLGSTPATAAPAAYPEPTDERSEREADLYEDATDAIDDEQWEEAIRKFARVAEMKGSRADGAVFWSAYALNKLGRQAEALKTIDALKKAYPTSRWLDDAQALEIEARQARGERVSPDKVSDDEMKMIAINSLMHSDPEKAYPLLEKIVRSGTASRKVRERAVFILSQSPSGRAQTLLGEIARGNSNPELQRDAVRYLGISGSQQSRQILADLYAAATSSSVKKEILKAFMLANDKARVLTAARSEKDTDLRGEAIRLLGVMNARAELVTLYGTETSRDMREEIIQGLFISGDSDKIGELAQNEKDQYLRKEAIQKLGLMGRKTAPTLLAMYARETSVDLKEAVIKGLFLQDNAKALIDIAKKETNKELRKEALQKLSLMNDDEALAYMLQILNE